MWKESDKECKIDLTLDGAQLSAVYVRGIGDALEGKKTYANRQDNIQYHAAGRDPEKGRK